MFADLLSREAGPAWALAFGILALFYVVRRVITDYQLKKIGGVRAPVLATNPLFCTQSAVRSPQSAVRSLLSAVYWTHMVAERLTD